MALTRLGLNQSINLATNTTGNLNLTSQVTGTLPTGNGGTGATSFSPGKIGQVVTSNINGSGINTSSTSYVSTGDSLSITPSATSSKILILFTGLEMDNQGATVAYATVYNGSTNLASSNTFFYLYGGARVAVSGTIHHIHSPNSTSAQTYTLYIKTNTGTVGFLEDSTDATFTLMEILA
tara:strand:+ start:11 stop:550 length:540 start_codon:yes stop_codon:yes gene_type:complete